ELTVLDEKLTRLNNVHVKAEEYDEEIVFLHKIEDGQADESYGIHVAKLANLPSSLIERATTILTELETGAEKSITPNETVNEDEGQLSFFTSSENKQEK